MKGELAISFSWRQEILLITQNSVHKDPLRITLLSKVHTSSKEVRVVVGWGPITTISIQTVSQ